MREKKEEIIGASCLVVFDALSRLDGQNLGIQAGKAIENALSVIPRIPGEILSRIDSDATSIIIDALTETEGYLNNAIENMEQDIEGIEDDEVVSQIMYLERLMIQSQRALKATGRRLVEKTNYRIWMPMDIWIVAIDETECWHLKDEDLDKCERIEGLYIFDKNDIKKYGDKSCYLLLGIRNRPIFKVDVSDDDQSRIGRLIAKSGEAANNYVSVRSLDKDIKKICDDKARCYHFGNPSFDLVYADDDEEENEKIMSIIRSWCSQTDILS
jgi:hypothetical protein